MIPAFIIWLVKKYLLPNKKDKKQPITGASMLRKKRIKLLLLLSLLAVVATAQQQDYHYYVLYKGNTIGDMYLTQKQIGNELSVKIKSDIQLSMLMSMKINIQEEASYKEDKLIYSTVYRKINGKQKLNRQTRYYDGCYEIVAEGKKGALNSTAINYNLVRLYCKEPVNINQVYSDAFQQFLNIKTLGAHQYKLDLPDGNYNVYHYQNGICSKVEVHNTLYTIQMQLAQNSIF